ncbi:high mobility group box domain-containing protein, partial [Rhodotorula diobovata]
SPNHVPRPRNAFILFRSHAVTAELIPRSMGITNISQVIGSVWRGLSPVERKKWEDLAEEEKRLHKERYPDYVFRPKQ